MLREYLGCTAAVSLIWTAVVSARRYKSRPQSIHTFARAEKSAL